MLETIHKEIIDEVAKEEGVLKMTVDDFITGNEAKALRDLLWYAKRNKVPVLFTSERDSMR